MQVVSKQNGLALLMLVFVLVLAASAYALKALNSAEIQDRKVDKTAEALAEAKAALLGWSVSHPLHPGIFPFPDRSADGNYDGNSDCTTSAVGVNLLIGKLPFLGQTTPCPAAAVGLASNLVDGEGEQLWYAVSRNLIRNSAITTLPSSPYINPSIVNSPSDNWLVVRDKYGNVISDRVAAVIIAPGLPVGSQDRSGSLAGPAAYLDSITVGGVVYSNNDYRALVSAEDFIMGEDMRNVSEADTNYSHPYQFNDRLVYITIDELMLALQKRVIREVALVLRSYYTGSNVSSLSRYYPYAAALGDHSDDGFCVDGLLNGQLPLGDCSTSGLKNATLSLPIPDWIEHNKWQQHIYYTISSDCTLASAGCALGEITVGTQANIHALVIATGPTVGAQSRPSALVTDYLDSVENTDGDNVYDAVGTSLTSIYNDQMLIVAP